MRPVSACHQWLVSSEVCSRPVKRVCSFDGFVMIFKTPPMASDPYRADEGPRTISIFSTSLILIRSSDIALPSPLASASLEIRRPFTMTRECFVSIPRMMISCPPPRTLDFWKIFAYIERAFRTLVAPPRLISSCVMTCVEAGTFFTSFSVRVAVTTTSSKE